MVALITAYLWLISETPSRNKFESWRDAFMTLDNIEAHYIHVQVIELRTFQHHWPGVFVLAAPLDPCTAL